MSGYRHSWQRFSSTQCHEPKVFPTPLRYATAPFWMPFTLLGLAPYFLVNMVVGFFWDFKHAPTGTASDAALLGNLPSTIAAPAILGVMTGARKSIPAVPDRLQWWPKSLPFWLIGAIIFWGVAILCLALLALLLAVLPS